jgi:hypothetical protein
MLIADKADNEQPEYGLPLVQSGQPDGAFLQ